MNEDLQWGSTPHKSYCGGVGEGCSENLEEYKLELKVVGSPFKNVLTNFLRIVL